MDNSQQDQLLTVLRQIERHLAPDEQQGRKVADRLRGLMLTELKDVLYAVLVELSHRLMIDGVRIRRMVDEMLEEFGVCYDPDGKLTELGRAYERITCGPR